MLLPFMKKRKSKIFGEFTERPHPIEQKIITKFPEKWILIDTENMSVYQGSDITDIGRMWKKIDDSDDVIRKLKKQKR